MSQIIINGGIAQGFYELAKECGCLSDKDSEELKRLQGLPPNRIEENGVPVLVQETAAALEQKPIVYSKVRKKGRCFNGFESDGGRIIHIKQGERTNGDWFGKALCGTDCGYRGNGWALSEKEPTCPKCIKKMEKINNASNQKQ